MIVVTHDVLSRLPWWIEKGPGFAAARKKSSVAVRAAEVSAHKVPTPIAYTYTFYTCTYTDTYTYTYNYLYLYLHL